MTRGLVPGVARGQGGEAAAAARRRAGQGRGATAPPGLIWPPPAASSLKALTAPPATGDAPPVRAEHGRFLVVVNSLRGVPLVRERGRAWGSQPLSFGINVKMIRNESGLLAKVDRVTSASITVRRADHDRIAVHRPRP